MLGPFWLLMIGLAVGMITTYLFLFCYFRIVEGRWPNWNDLFGPVQLQPNKLQK